MAPTVRVKVVASSKAIRNQKLDRRDGVVVQLFEGSVERFDRLFQRKAFLDQFQKENVSEGELTDSRMVVQDMADDYLAAAKDNYPDYVMEKVRASCFNHSNSESLDNCKVKSIILR